MSIKKLLKPHEIETLYTGANAAVWHAHELANYLSSKRKTREEDHVATLVTNGIPFLAERWIPLLQSKRIGLRLSGVFCHGHPQVKFGTPSNQVELADLLIVHQHTQGKRASARAILLQAKMSADSTHLLPAGDAQLQLFSHWPPFEFVTGGLASGIRNLNETGRGSRYALVLDRQAYPEQIVWADQCPWAASPATQRLTADRSLARMLGDMILGKEGRPFKLGTTKDEWSKTIQELLEVTGRKTYKRKNINRGDTPRLSGDVPVGPGIMFMMLSGAPSSIDASRSSASIHERYFGSVPTVQGDGDGFDTTSNVQQINPEGGISTLLVETIEEQG
ncbi:hypothetical protein LIN78_15255 [Leeia sp. TBRC 13508]|uniref:Uncharacterized protein n=1 Tax=Leeia speluncae TaxID=2884804 RepID=A0ABS8D9M6_9NEIS|nr:hypothetical protein [Leeia speluncae]MCB6184904.1 hypothetical protein [Leeia speluncae]